MSNRKQPLQYKSKLCKRCKIIYIRNPISEIYHTKCIELTEKVRKDILKSRQRYY